MFEPKKKLIVGLGNPGEKYKNTRHNVGFIVVDAFVEKLGLKWAFDKRFNAEVATNNEYIFVKPQTYMNESGTTVKKLVSYFGTDHSDLIIVHDDVDLEASSTRFKKGSGAAGHHGVEDIIKKLGSNDFWRLRVGIGRPANKAFDVHGFVLGRLPEEFITGLTDLLSTLELKLSE